MKFKVDENLPVEVADVLRREGHDAATALEQQRGGGADEMLAALCQSESQVFVTLDLDFADIRSYPPADYPGLIVFRLSQQDKPHLLGVLAHLVPLLEQEPLERQLWIVEERRVRIRG